MDTEAWKQYIKLKIYKLQQIFRPRIISDASTSEKLYNGEIKMYFYLAMVGYYIYIYIYIEREREREREIVVDLYNMILPHSAAIFHITL